MLCPAAACPHQGTPDRLLGKASMMVTPKNRVPGVWVRIIVLNKSRGIFVLDLRRSPRWMDFLAVFVTTFPAQSVLTIGYHNYRYLSYL